MTWTDTVYQALGVTSQLVIVGSAVASVEAIRRTCAGQWGRMVRTARGEVVPSLYPVASASKAPTPDPTLIAEEARGQGNQEVRA
ncbi:hypothetical protein SAMN05192583_0600 [Sphingomonas gellani]|uniref:Uncharacterized protein n=1 Tax=Sphingomonas gellani TaxID=1166340 RepID=A0A1H7ZAK6_9SPHN|nr:hypothetical protein [Sphingomonas gellani]SEM55241.1 hypothetical protein SAMN05192583_0600 [Sphingomonas gellani]